jgi:glutamate 5-kinase
MREMIAEVEHEIKMRREVASRQVSTGRMAAKIAWRRIASRETVATIQPDLQGP